MSQQSQYLIGMPFSAIKKITLDNLLIMWYSNTITNQEVVDYALRLNQRQELAYV